METAFINPRRTNLNLLPGSGSMNSFWPPARRASLLDTVPAALPATSSMLVQVPQSQGGLRKVNPSAFNIGSATLLHVLSPWAGAVNTWLGTGVATAGACVHLVVLQTTSQCARQPTTLCRQPPKSRMALGSSKKCPSSRLLIPCIYQLNW